MLQGGLRMFQQVSEATQGNLMLFQEIFQAHSWGALQGYGKKEGGGLVSFRSVLGFHEALHEEFDSQAI